MKTHQFQRHGVVRIFGQWAVTAFGLENLSGPCRYDIDRESLAHAWWSDHMREKNWVVGDDFDAALDFAREHFGVTIGGGCLW